MARIVKKTTKRNTVKIRRKRKGGKRCPTCGKFR